MYAHIYLVLNVAFKWMVIITNSENNDASNMDTFKPTYHKKL